MVAAGQLNRKVSFRRRNVAPNEPRHLREGWETLGNPTWAAWKEERAREITVGGFRLWARGGILTLREDSVTRTVTCSDQVTLDGHTFNLVGRVMQPIPDGSIKFQAQSAPCRDLYEQEMDRSGELVTIRRIVANDDPIDAEARAIITGNTAAELAGGITQGVRQVLLLAADMESNGFPLPLKRNDRIIARDWLLNIEDVDDNTHRFAGELNAYALKAKG